MKFVTGGCYQGKQQWVLTDVYKRQALDSIRQKYGSKAVMRGSFREEKRPPKATPYE